MYSVIVCSIDPQRFAAVKTTYTAAMGDEPWEMIGIHDARSLAEAYNRGVSSARGDKLIFSHDDIEILSPDFPNRLTNHLAKYDIVGVAGTSRVVRGTWGCAGYPYVFGQIAMPNADGSIRVWIWSVPRPVISNIQAIDGVFMAVRRSVFPKVAFDANTFDGFHVYDLDFSYAAHRAGLTLAIANDLNLFHASGGKWNDTWRNYVRRFDQKWFPNIPLPPQSPYVAAGMDVQTRAQALEVMNPPYWQQSEA